MKKISFITPPDASYGFSLTGLPQAAVEAADAEEALQRSMADPDVGLAIIDERLMSRAQTGQGMTPERVQELEQGWHGILLVLPAPEKPPEDVEDYTSRLIRRAIGYHVRLKL
jgi:V/A-type H+-transporting ATPase subunit F